MIDHLWMPEPRIKRFALVPNAREDGIKRFHLARVASASRSVPGADRLERMEEIAALDRRDEHTDSERRPPG